MHFQPSPLAIALAIILSSSSVQVNAAPHRRHHSSHNERSSSDSNGAYIEPRQGAAQRNAHVHGLMDPASSLMLTAAPTTPEVTATSIRTITLVPTPARSGSPNMPIAIPENEAGTMKPRTSSSTTTNSVVIVPTLSTIVIPTMSLPPSVNNANSVASSALALATNLAVASSSSSSSTQSQSQSLQSTSSQQKTCPAGTRQKCCTTVDQVSSNTLELLDDVIPILQLEKLEADAATTNALALSCEDNDDSSVCGNVVSCCTEQSILGLGPIFTSCVPLL